MHTAFLFPGQGSQSANFLHALPNHEAVRDVFDEARSVLGADPRDLDSEAALKSTVAVQISVLIAGVKQEFCSRCSFPTPTSTATSSNRSAGPSGN